MGTLNNTTEEKETRQRRRRRPHEKELVRYWTIHCPGARRDATSPNMHFSTRAEARRAYRQIKSQHPDAVLGCWQVDRDYCKPDENEQIRRRLVAILDYDGIPKASRVTHITKSCGISRSSARRFLGDGDFGRSRLFVHLAIGLNVCVGWLFEGKFERFDPRGWRIYLQEIKGYPKEDADRIIRLIIGYVAGHQKCTNLTKLVVNGSLSALQAGRLL